MRSKSWLRVRGSRRSSNWISFSPSATAPRRKSAFPVWPGHPTSTAHWGIEDPSHAGGGDLQKRAAFLDRLPGLKNRIAAFSAPFPLEASTSSTLGRQAPRGNRRESVRPDPWPQSATSATVACDEHLRTLSSHSGSRFASSPASRSGTSSRGCSSVVAGAEMAQGQSAGGRTDLAHDRANAAQDRLRLAWARCASTGAASA